MPDMRMVKASAEFDGWVLGFQRREGLTDAELEQILSWHLESLRDQLAAA